MSSTQHTGVVVSKKEAEAWHAEIRKIMAAQGLNFGDAVNVYITSRHGYIEAAVKEIRAIKID